MHAPSATTIMGAVGKTCEIWERNLKQILKARSTFPQNASIRSSEAYASLYNAASCGIMLNVTSDGPGDQHFFWSLYFRVWSNNPRANAKAAFKDRNGIMCVQKRTSTSYINTDHAWRSKWEPMLQTTVNNESVPVRLPLDRSEGAAQLLQSACAHSWFEHTCFPERPRTYSAKFLSAVGPSSACVWSHLVKDFRSLYPIYLLDRSMGHTSLKRIQALSRSLPVVFVPISPTTIPSLSLPSVLISTRNPCGP